MSGFHTATICADCDPPVVAISTGFGSRCPRCGQIAAWSLLTTDAIDTRLDGALARQIIAATAVRSDGDARLLGELARRLLDRAGSGFTLAGKVQAIDEALLGQEQDRDRLATRSQLGEAFIAGYHAGWDRGTDKDRLGGSSGPGVAFEQWFAKLGKKGSL